MRTCKAKDCTNEVREDSPEDICNFCIADLHREGLIDIEPDSEYPSIHSPTDVLEVALKLAISAPTEEQSMRAIAEAISLANTLPAATVKAVKAKIDRELEEFEKQGGDIIMTDLTKHQKRSLIEMARQLALYTKKPGRKELPRCAWEQLWRHWTNKYPRQSRRSVDQLRTIALAEFEKQGVI